MKIVFFGDSITDAGRNRELDGDNSSLGRGYVVHAASRLLEREPDGYEIINRGISGDRVVDLYARIKRDVWNLHPDLLSIYIGVNDVWHEIDLKNGVEQERFERIYKTMLDETIERLPDTKIMLVAPFVQRGRATEEKFGEFEEVYEYAAIVKRIAEEYRLPLVELQKPFDDAAEKYGIETLTHDGVHPTVRGAILLAGEWLKAFDKM
jgi:lysophospholipase L1-like esterase